MGRAGGQFFGLQMIGHDSRGYIYTGEVFSGAARAALRDCRQSTGKCRPALAPAIDRGKDNENAAVTRRAPALGARRAGVGQARPSR